MTVITQVLDQQAVDQQTAVSQTSTQQANAATSLLALFGLLANSIAGSQLSTTNSSTPVASALVSAITAPTDSGYPFPIPSTPASSGAPDPSIPSTQPYNSSLTGYLDKLQDMISYIKNHPSDPIAVQNLVAYIGNLSKAGLMTDDTKALLDKADIISLIDYAIPQNVELAFFAGYKGQTGEAAAQAYINDFLTAVGGMPSNKYTDEMKKVLNFQNQFLDQFTKDHYDASTGTYYWTLNGIGGVANAGVTLDWSDSDDQQKILDLIYNQGVTGAPNTYPNNLDINSFLRDYRLRALAQLLQAFSDPMLAIMIWLTQSYDNEYQGQIGGYAGTADLLTNMTNNIANPLATIANKIGTMTDADAQQFKNLLFGGTAEIDLQNGSSSFASQWNTNTFQTIGNIPVTFTSSTGQPVTDSLMNVMLGGNPATGAKYTGSDLTSALNSLNPQNSTGAPNPGYQTVISALQSGGALITETSKTVNTQLSQVTSLDSAVVKLGSSVVDPNAGGFMTLIKTLVQNQISR